MSRRSRRSELSEGAALAEIFPCCDFRLAERTQIGTPVWKTKCPLLRVGRHFSFLHGGRLPHTGRPTAHVPLRAVIHQFEWRDRQDSTSAP